jgi:isopenicillin N synthase-like dioxygenase
MPHKVQLDFDEIPILDYSLLETDRDTYFKQLRNAWEEVGFLVSCTILLLPKWEP